MNTRLNSAYVVLIAILFFFNMNSYGQECVPSSESCQFYLCKDQELNCGPRGYLQFYGHYFCETYRNNNSHLSSAGKLWLYGVRLCLQQKLEQESQHSQNCQALHKAAISSHIECYVNTGYCQLTDLDQLKVKAIAAQEVLRSGRVIDSLTTLSAINHRCYTQKGSSSTGVSNLGLRKSGGSAFGETSAYRP